MNPNLQFIHYCRDQVLHSLFIRIRKLHLSCVLQKKPLKPPPHNFKKFPQKGTIQWLSKQLADPYVKLRHKEGYRCRSVYKLKEIDEKYQVLKPGMKVVDLGAAPGSWCQVVVEKIFCNNEESNSKIDNSKVIGVDLQKFSSLDNVIQITGDFTDSAIQKQICALLEGKADVILCDAAPNAAGHKDHDHIVLIKLITKAANFSLQILKPGGSFLFKVWKCPEVAKIKLSLAQYFKNVHSVKPAASRSNSAESYILCLNFKGSYY